MNYDIIHTKPLLVCITYKRKQCTIWTK